MHAEQVSQELRDLLFFCTLTIEKEIDESSDNCKKAFEDF